MSGRGRRPRKTSYLILWSRNDRLEPGNFIRSIDVGEIAFFTDVEPRGEIPSEEPVAVGLRVYHSSLPAAIKILLRNYNEAQIIAELTGLTTEQVREAILAALRNIINKMTRAVQQPA